MPAGVFLTVGILGGTTGPGPGPTPTPGALDLLGQVTPVRDVPHLAWPLRLAASGSLAIVEQDTIDDVRQCVHVLLNTPLGARLLAPEVGVEDPTFTTGIDAQALAALLEDQEDRARVHITAAGPTGDGQHAASVVVELAADPEQGGL